MATNKLLGRGTAGTGAIEELTLGTGLSLSGTTLNASGGVTSVSATAPLTSSGGATPDISTSIATNKIVGRSTAGTGVMEELTPVGISVSAGNITGIGGTLGTVDNAVPRADGTGGYTAQGSNIVIDDATTSTANNVAITNQHTGQTNSALVLSPKGTGAFILGPKPDGTTTGGNARGSRAVDLQISRGNAAQVASGANSFAAGYNNTSSAAGTSALGYLNTVTAPDASNGWGFAAGAVNTCNSNSYPFALGGFNEVTGAYAGAFGLYAQSTRTGMMAYASERFAATGDAQRARFTLLRKTTNNTATELTLSGTAPGSTTRLTIPSGKIFAFTINISGVKSDGSAVAHYLRQYALKNVAGTTTEVYAPVTIGTDNAAGTTIALSANDTNDALKVEVTGITSETWRWVASVDAVEIAYGA